MTDPDNIQRDKAIILSIIKYLLIVIVAGLLIYFGLRLFVILLPFVFGYILARVSTLIVSGVKNTVYSIRQRSSNRTAKVPDLTEAQSDRQTRPKKKIKYPHGLARSRGEKRSATVVYILLLLIFISLIVAMVLMIIGQLRSLATNLPTLFSGTDFLNRIINYIDQFSERLGGFIPPQYLQALESELSNIQQRLLQGVSTLVGSVLNGLASFAGNLPVVFFMIVVVIMSGYYFIADSRTIYAFLHRNITSRAFREKTIRLINSLFNKLFRVIGGYLLLFILTYVMAYIGLLIIRMPYAAITALIVAIVDLLPILGIAATMVPIAIYMFIQGEILSGIGALVIMLVITFIRRFIEPTIFGNAMHLHPLATLASMIIGVGVYGLGGLLLGPIILVVVQEVITLFGIDQVLRNWLGGLLNRMSR